MKFLLDTLVAFVMIASLLCAFCGVVLAWMGVCIFLVGDDWFLLPWSAGMILAIAATLAWADR